MRRKEIDNIGAKSIALTLRLKILTKSSVPQDGTEDWHLHLLNYNYRVYNSNQW